MPRRNLRCFSLFPKVENIVVLEAEIGQAKAFTMVRPDPSDRKTLGLIVAKRAESSQNLVTTRARDQTICKFLGLLFRSKGVVAEFRKQLYGPIPDSVEITQPTDPRPKISEDLQGIGTIFEQHIDTDIILGQFEALTFEEKDIDWVIVHKSDF